MAGNRSFYKTDYTQQVLQAYEALMLANLDCNIVNLRQLRMDYKILIVPGHAVMDSVSAATIRAFAENGGTVVMTAYSAKVNEHNQVFDTPLPGELSDVFGIRSGAFMRTRSHTPAENAGGLEKTELRLEREKPSIVLGGCEYQPDIDYYEILEVRTADILATFSNTLEKSPAVTRNRYGKGEAVYVAIPANTHFLEQLLKSFYPALGIQPGPITPIGVVARTLENGSILYVNTTGAAQSVKLEAPASGFLTDARFVNSITLDAYEVELLINQTAIEKENQK